MERECLRAETQPPLGQKWKRSTNPGAPPSQGPADLRGPGGGTQDIGSWRDVGYTGLAKGDGWLRTRVTLTRQEGSCEQNKTEGRLTALSHELLAKGWKPKKRPLGSLGVSSTPGSCPVQLRACRETVTLGLSPGAWDENKTDRADRVASLSCAPEIYIMLLTRVTPVHLIKTTTKNKTEISKSKAKTTYWLHRLKSQFKLTIKSLTLKTL